MKSKRFGFGFFEKYKELFFCMHFLQFHFVILQKIKIKNKKDHKSYNRIKCPLQIYRSNRLLLNF